MPSMISGVFGGRGKLSEKVRENGRKKSCQLEELERRRGGVSLLNCTCKQKCTLSCALKVTCLRPLFFNIALLKNFGPSSWLIKLYDES